MSTKKQIAVQEPDPHEGMGGSYVVNPETGARELVERTEEPNVKENGNADAQS